MKYYIIAGEASGDLHASNLIYALKGKDPQAEFRAWGGDLMQAAGATIVKHYRDLAFMGFVEVLLNLRTILRNFRFCKEDIAQYKPDAVILVDYPGFNLRMAKHLKKEGIRVIYYISPQIWAWHASRAKDIKKSVDKMLVILPFEKDFYKKYQMEVDFVGHPLLDAIKKFRGENNFYEKYQLDTAKKLVALLPGSRKQEVRKILPVLLEVIPQFSDCQFVLAAAPSLDDAFFTEFEIPTSVKRIYNDTYNILQHADAALVGSGTATLETALWKVPQVVVYKSSPISFWIGKQLVNVRYISLVNLIADRAVVEELIQENFTRENLQKSLYNLLYNASVRTQMLADYEQIAKSLGGEGASERAAAEIVHFLSEKT
ncbi:MAG: lipid-A-disaccharide synthase [Chitinophagales bacterium]|nr:lipid-A-disaccharide synthase [Bacteroidota bacterium]MCB9042992.1 lipid-A-disaccharide synthase [Chitinophagales bacterium]